MSPEEHDVLAALIISIDHLTEEIQDLHEDINDIGISVDRTLRHEESIALLDEDWNPSDED